MVLRMLIWLGMGLFRVIALIGTTLAVSTSPGVLDQSFIPGNSGLGAVLNEGFKFTAQTFTAGASGKLEAIEIVVETFTSAKLNDKDLSA